MKNTTYIATTELL